MIFFLLVIELNVNNFIEICLILNIYIYIYMCVCVCVQTLYSLLELNKTDYYNKDNN